MKTFLGLLIILAVLLVPSGELSAQKKNKGPPAAPGPGRVDDIGRPENLKLGSEGKAYFDGKVALVIDAKKMIVDIRANGNSSWVAIVVKDIKTEGLVTGQYMDYQEPGSKSVVNGPAGWKKVTGHDTFKVTSTENIKTTNGDKTVFVLEPLEKVEKK